MYIAARQSIRKRMLSFQILDVDYVLVDGRPVVRLFGKTAGGEGVCVFYERYLPYFYTDSDVRELLKNETGIVKVSKVKRKTVMDSFDYKHVIDPSRDVYKVTIKNPAQTPEFREKLRSRGIRVFEGDVLFKYRFMNDMGLGGMEWASVEENNGVSTNTVSVKRKIKAADIKPIKKDGDAPLKYMAFDIECVAMRRGEVPEASKDPVVLISFVFSEPHKRQKSLVIGTKPCVGAQDFPTEKALLEEFIRIIEEYDPDVITGYNINNFDLPYILERMKRNNVRPVFGRCAQKQVISRKLGPRYKVSISGRVVFDSFEVVKKDFSLQRYSLEYVARKLLNEKKVNVRHSEIDKLWAGSQKDRERLAEYCRVDSVLALNLVQKLNLVDKYLALSRLSGTLLQDTLDSGETVRIENFLLREFNKQGYVFPGKPTQEEVRKREKARRVELGGGFVIEPKKGLHSNVVVLDFKSMYPSIIQTFNICPTTIVKYGTDAPDLVKTCAGTHYLSSKTRQGIIPKVLEQLMKQRGEVKKKMRSATDKDRKRTLFAKQWALKIMANAFYGLMGYSRARVYDLDVANTITACGRDIIQNTKKEIEKRGYEVVYGDTDSVFVKMPTADMEEISRRGERISAEITQQLPGVIELEFEKIFRRFLPLTKKRYAAWRFERGTDGWEEGIEMKGIETVRRDWCELVSDSVSYVIETILKENDVKGAVKYFKTVIDNLINGKIDIQKLVITKTMTKSPKSYVGIQPHIELVKKIAARAPGEAPGVGDRIGYVIVKGTQLLSKRAEDPTYVIEHGVQTDSGYYIENQLLPPLERVFGALGVSKSELLGNGKQMGLFDVFKEQAFKKAATGTAMKGVHYHEVGGFVCTSCHKDFQRMPLLGVCECGGEIVFSTPHGPAHTVLLTA